MKFKEYLEYANELAKKHPEYLELDVCYSIDDEGNGYCKNVYAPSAGVFDGGYIGDFSSDLKMSGEKPNAICIN